MSQPEHELAPVVAIRQATLRYGARTLFGGLDMCVRPGEFVAVLGPNGVGKTSLLRVILGLERLTTGRVEIAGVAPRAARHLVSYVPQQRGFDRDLPIRGRDLVALGLDGNAVVPRRPARRRAAVDAAIAAVGATSYATAPIGLLSGGEQQRLRIAQALVADPRVLLCDEPLLSLDLANQQAVTQLIDQRRTESGTAVIFVTHEINPILEYVDRVLYLVGGRWAVGTPSEVLTTERLSELYGAPIDVLDVRGRIVVVGASDGVLTEAHGHHHHAEGDRR